jgi:hypothetical protein
VKFPSAAVEALVADPDMLEKLCHFITYFQSFFEINRFVSPPIHQTLVKSVIPAFRNLDGDEILKWLKEQQLVVNQLLAPEDVSHWMFRSQEAQVGLWNPEGKQITLVDGPSKVHVWPQQLVGKGGYAHVYAYVHSLALFP